MTENNELEITFNIKKFTNDKNEINKITENNNIFSYSIIDDNKIFINTIELNSEPDDNFIIYIDREFDFDFGIDNTNVKIKKPSINNNNLELFIQDKNVLTETIDDNKFINYENIPGRKYVIGLTCNDTNYYYENSGGGNCLFYAFAQIFDNTKTHGLNEELRGILRMIYADLGKDENNILKSENNYNIPYENASSNDSSNKEKSFVEYSNYISNDGTWATNEDLRILCKYFNINFFVVVNTYENNILKNTTKHEIIINNKIKDNFYTFCNNQDNHWVLKKHNKLLDYNSELVDAKKRYSELVNANMVYDNIEENVEKETLDENKEITNIINAIEQFINGTVNSSGIGSDNGTDNDSGIGNGTSNDTNNDNNTPIGDITETKLKDFFMKTSYIITKNGQKYLFAEVETAPSTTISATNTNKQIYNNDGITITEYWQNKTITNELDGYSITDGTEKYFVVPGFDINTIK